MEVGHFNRYLSEGGGHFTQAPAIMIDYPQCRSNTHVTTVTTVPTDGQNTISLCGRSISGRDLLRLCFISGRIGLYVTVRDVRNVDFKRFSFAVLRFLICLYLYGKVIVRKRF